MGGAERGGNHRNPDGGAGRPAPAALRVPTPSGQAPGPGWYGDPGGTHQYRFWNGWAWTPGVADGGQVREDFGQAGAPSASSGRPDTRIRLPRAAAGLAIAGVVVSLVIASVALAAAAALYSNATPASSRLAQLVASEIGLWAGLLGTVWLASRRWGTGDVFADFGVRITGLDSVRGLVVAIAGRVGGGVVAVILVGIDSRFAGTNVNQFSGAKASPALYVAMVVIAVLGAPFVEELFFRGLLLRSLLPFLGTAGAVVVQSLIFATLHLRPSYGLGNVTIFAAIALMGLLLGIVAERFRRLGPGMVAHGIFNLVAVLIASAV